MVGYLSLFDLAQELREEAMADSFGASLPTFTRMAQG